MSNKKFFHKTLRRTCSICGNPIRIQLRRPWWGWPPWGWKIIGGGIYWGLLDTAEDWECIPCSNGVADHESNP